jgi:hypothetical protein
MSYPPTPLFPKATPPHCVCGLLVLVVLYITSFVDFVNYLNFSL